MTAQIKMGFKLIRYAYKLEMNIIIGVFMLVGGAALDLCTHGTVFLGVFLISCFSMFPVQFLYNVCMANAAGASPWRKRMQTTMPALLAFAINVIEFTILIVIKMVEIYLFPQDTSVILGCLVMVAVLQILLGIYNGLCYKYFAISMIVMYIVIFGCSFLGGYTMVSEESMSVSINMSVSVLCSPPGAIVVTYGSLVVAAILQYVVSLAVYKKPLSKWAQGAAMRKHL